jgi:hypothetical protein
MGAPNALVSRADTNKVAYRLILLFVTATPEGLAGIGKRASDPWFMADLWWNLLVFAGRA